MDDQRVGRALRLLRQRRGVTQAELGAVAGVSQSLVSLLERGHVDAISLRALRRVFAALDARCAVDVSWRGGALDRLLDEVHKGLVMRQSAALRDGGWAVAIEATYSVFGERALIDVLAARPVERAVLVEEVKSDLTSLEALGRKTDEKTRLVRTRLCRDRFGFDPVAVGRILVLPDTSTARRQVARLAVALDVLFPARTRELRAWLRRPSGSISGILFVADASRPGAHTNGRGSRCDQRGRRRVSRPREVST